MDHINYTTPFSVEVSGHRLFWISIKIRIVDQRLSALASDLEEHHHKTMVVAIIS